MFETYYKIKEFWEEYNYEIVVFSILIFILLMSLYRKINGYSGRWSNQYFYDRLRIRQKPDTVLFGNSGKKDSKGEVECRRVLEKLFRKKFDKIRPNFLSNPVTDGNYNLEIDCYNEQLRLGVEYSGKQHYEYVPFFHRNKEAFYNQKYRDELKRRMCKDNNIILIEVPYTVKIDDIEYFLVDELEKNGYKI